MESAQITRDLVDFCALMGVEGLENIVIDANGSEPFELVWTADWGPHKIGSTLRYPDGAPDEERLINDIRKSAADSILLMTRPDGRYTYAARQAFKFDPNNPFRGLFLYQLQGAVVGYLNANGGLLPTAKYLYRQTIVDILGDDVYYMISEMAKAIKTNWETQKNGQGNPPVTV